MGYPIDPVAVYCILSSKGYLHLCQNYTIISFITHSRKFMLIIILNMLKPQTEEIFAVEKAGLRAGMSTTKDIFNFRILCEKYLQHHQSLFQCFFVFEKVTHGVLATMRKYNISVNLFCTIEQLYDWASAVQVNNSTREWLRTTAGGRQGCLL